MIKRLLAVLLITSCTPKKETTEPPAPVAARACEDKDFTDVFQAKASLNPTEVGATCTKDYDCWLGQVCTMGKCAAVANTEKLQSEVTLRDAGNYMVSVFAPVDAAADVTAKGEIVVSFGEFPARDSRILEVVRRPAPADMGLQAMLASRVRYEPSLRAGEAAALQQYGKLPVAAQEEGPGRQATCAANEFGFRNNCYAENVALPGELKFKKPDGTLVSLSVKVSKVVGKTAVLVDVSSPIAASGAADIATKFDTIAGPRDRQVFNNNGDHKGQLDTDGNGKIAIVLSNKVGDAGLAGIFQFGDVLPATDPNATGNVMDMLWSVPAGQTFTPMGSSTAVTATPAYVMGTLAHEYQHVINFARAQAQMPAKTETLFLNEGLSHLAEDLSGYGASNVTTVQVFLQNPELVGLAFQEKGEDRDSSEMRGLVYLYLRWAFERAGGTSARDAAGGAFTDKGGLAFIEKLFTAKTTGLDTLASVVGSSYCRFPLFFPALAISNNPDNAPLVQTDARFNFKKPEIDALTLQPVGINLNDRARKDAFDTGDHLVGYVPKECDSPTKAAKDCSIYAAGGVTFLWEDAPANATVSVKTGAANNVRLSVVKVK